MKVKELIEILKECDMDREVICEKDAEENVYSPLYSIFTCSYRADTTYSGKIGLEKLTKKLEKLGYAEEDVIKGGVPAITLNPTY